MASAKPLLLHTSFGAALEPLGRNYRVLSKNLKYGGFLKHRVCVSPMGIRCARRKEPILCLRRALKWEFYLSQCYTGGFIYRVDACRNLVL